MLLTKLHRPHVAEGHVLRDELIHGLNKSKRKPLTLVSAGAGYGKSTLISSWLEQSKSTYAWFSLDDNDNNLRCFIRGICTSVRKKYPEALSELQGVLEVSPLPKIELIQELLINGLDEISGYLVLVLDDYHVINNLEINELIDKLLHYPPHGFRLVIITRCDPFLNLVALRSYGCVHDIRMIDLCFKENEISHLFKHLVDVDVDAENIASLLHLTEGWITGLRLSSLVIKDKKNIKMALEELNTKNQLTNNFLLKEVISNLPKQIQDCLVKVSILDRFCSDLLQELCFSNQESKNEKSSGKEVIEMFLEFNLFTISLDNDKKWYRFHHLFQDLLQIKTKEQYSKQVIGSWYLKAAHWFDKKDLKNEAIQNALNANNVTLAVEFIKKYRYYYMNSSQMLHLEKLIDWLPERILMKEPLLLTAKAFISDYKGQLTKIFSFKDKAKSLLLSQSFDPEEVRIATGEIETLEGERFLFSGEHEKALKCSNRALALLPDDAYHIRSYVAGIQVIYRQISNNISDLKKAGLPKIHSTLFSVRMHLWYVISYAMEGDTVQLKKSASTLIALGKKHESPESIMFGTYFKAVGHYLSFEWDKSENLLKKIIDSPYSVRPNYLSQSAFILASLYIAKGQPSMARELIKSVENYVIKSNLESLVPILKAMQVDLALKERDIERAIDLNDEVKHYALLPILWFFYVPQLTQVKFKLALDTAESIAEAQELLTNLEEISRQSNKKTILIDILLLQAIALKKQFHEKAAVLKIKEALNLGYKGNCIRPFTEFGAAFESLILGIKPTAPYKSFLSEIKKNISVLSVEKMNESKRKSNNKDYILLSYRELEVLVLVSKGMRNKEISEQLFVQTSTIKKHLKNIFTKLNVSNRVMAVKKATELSLMHQH